MMTPATIPLIGSGEFGAFVLVPVFRIHVVVLDINCTALSVILFSATLEKGECYHSSDE